MLSYAAPAYGHAGLRGVVTFGGQCGSGSVPSPAPRPFDANVRIKSADTQALVKVVRSGRDGRFRIGLTPDRYTVEPGRPREDVGHALSKDTTTLTVTEHRFPTVHIFYDNGCR
jgi:hypothetical protein